MGKTAIKLAVKIRDKKKSGVNGKVGRIVRWKSKKTQLKQERRQQEADRQKKERKLVKISTLLQTNAIDINESLYT